LESSGQTEKSHAPSEPKLNSIYIADTNIQPQLTPKTLKSVKTMKSEKRYEEPLKSESVLSPKSESKQSYLNYQNAQIETIKDAYINQKDTSRFLKESD
jgi:hypothetical protein